MLCVVKKKRWYIDVRQETVFIKFNFITLYLMKWNILLIRRKETKKYFESTGEGTWNRPVLLLNLLKKIFENITEEGISPVLSK
jgi:hypothetical protein